MPLTCHIAHDEFVDIDSKSKTPMGQCLYGQAPSGIVVRNNLHRKKDHLAKWLQYQRQLKQKLEAAEVVPDRTVLPFSSAPVLIKPQRDRLLACAIFAGGLPFSVYSPKKYLEPSNFVRSFAASWQPPSRKKLAGSLLDEDYERVAKLVEDVLKGEGKLNLTADESTAASSDRVANIAVNTAASSSFHLQMVKVKDVNVTAEEVARLVTEHAATLRPVLPPSFCSLPTSDFRSLRSS